MRIVDIVCLCRSFPDLFGTREMIEGENALPNVANMDSACHSIASDLLFVDRWFITKRTLKSTYDSLFWLRRSRKSTACDFGMSNSSRLEIARGKPRTHRICMFCKIFLCCQQCWRERGGRGWLPTVMENFWLFTEELIKKFSVLRCFCDFSIGFQWFPPSPHLEILP
jgi:hypothetical protein